MAYHIELDNFEGPFDLLLHLIGQARIEISAIFVSPIIDQYLEYVRNMSAEDMDRTSEFVAMAARLLEMKARSLLPKPAPEEDEEDDAARLIQQLELYKQYKEISQSLRDKEEAAALVHYRLPDEFFRQQVVTMADMTMEQLLKAFAVMQARLAMAEEEAPKGQAIEREHFSIRQQVLFLQNRLRAEGRVSFDSLFRPRASREEIITTFLALLEMARRGMVFATQVDEDHLILERKELDQFGEEPLLEDSGY